MKTKIELQAEYIQNKIGLKMMEFLDKKVDKKIDIGYIMERVIEDSKKKNEDALRQTTEIIKRIGLEKCMRLMDNNVKK